MRRQTEQHAKRCAKKLHGVPGEKIVRHIAQENPGDQRDPAQPGKARQPA